MVAVIGAVGGYGRYIGEPIDFSTYFSPIWQRYPGPDYPDFWQQLIGSYPGLQAWLQATYGWPEGAEEEPPPEEEPTPPWLEHIRRGTLPREWEFPMEGLPRYPTAQHWFRMGQSEREGLQGMVETKQGYWPDYYDWMIRSWVPGTEKRLQPEWAWR